MTTARLFVTLAGLVVVVGVLWYFLGPRGSSRRPGGTIQG
jgi:hypothetical protein